MVASYPSIPPAKPRRKPSYVARPDAEDIQERLSDVRERMAGLVTDLGDLHAEGLTFPLDTSRWLLGALRDVGLLTTGFHVTLAHATDPWIPGLAWDEDHTRLMAAIGAAEALLSPDAPAVLRLGTVHRITLGDALDAVTAALARYRSLLAAARRELPAEADNVGCPVAGDTTE